MLHKQIIVIIFVGILVYGCGAEQTQLQPTLDWKAEVLQSQAAAFTLDPQLRIDSIIVSSSPYTIDNEYELSTVLDFVSHDDHASYRKSFNETEVTQELEYIGWSGIEQMHGYTLLNEIQILPSQLISITQTELAAYRPLTTPQIDVMFWLRTSTSVPEQFKPAHRLVWQVRYHGRYSDNALLVWVDAETGEVLGSELQEHDE